MSSKEAMDSGVSRRRASAPKAGSVWETRMKLDQVKGGIKVFNANHQDPQENAQIVCTTATPVSDDKEAIGCVDQGVGAKQSPARGGSGSAKRKTWKSDGLEDSPIQIGRQRSQLCKNLDEKFDESSDSALGNAKKSPVRTKETRPVPVQSRKAKSDEHRDENSEPGKVEEQLTNGDSKKSLSPPSVKVKRKGVEGTFGKFDEMGANSRSQEELGGCEVKSVATNADNIKNTEQEEEKNGIEIPGKHLEIKGNKPKKSVIPEKNLEIKEMSFQENKPKKFAIQEKKLLLGNEKSVANPPIVKKQLPHVKFLQNPTKTNPIPDSHGVLSSGSKLQSFADLIMWRDVAKSSFIFGIGTFAIISSSYTKDLNISFISVVAYLGLAYLVVNFLFRSLGSRGSVVDNGIEDYVMGEEEAIGAIKLLLPFVNEFLLKLRALFSGDPATTMKMAVLLFVVARCGSSITMWKMAKFGFIGVFTVPKVCSCYSVQITAYGTFLIRRLGDAWESCSHKKAVGFAIFSLVWNLSSVMARVWTVFMLYVAFKCYQQSLVRDECEGAVEGTSAAKVQRQQMRDSEIQNTRI